MGLIKRIVARIKNRRKKMVPALDPVDNTYNKDSAIDPPQWVVLSSIKPEETGSQVLSVSYNNEISMSNIVHCVAVFENKSEYKLVAPWLGSGRILQKGNLTDFQVDRVPKNSAGNLIE